MSALAFSLVALMLVGPVPALLARASWPQRAPRAAIVLWQSVAIAAVLSAFSAGIAVASRLFAPGPDGRPTTTATSEIAVMGWPLWITHVAVFALTLVVGARLAVAFVQVAIATRRRRAHHRMIVDLLDCSRDSAPAPQAAVGLARRHRHLLGHSLRILDVEQPLAYCLPGVRSRVVLSEGALKHLHDSEIAAILSHEHAHLRARHDLVLEMFIAVHAAFPRFVRSASALDAVRLLIELLADDAAVRATGPTPLARALVACASGRAPKGALAAGGPTTVLRVQRLAGEPNSNWLAAGAYLAAASVLVVPTVAVAVPWLTELHRLFFS
ncbi:Zn-dependent protease with chaperone function [Mycobacterium sp. CBMA 234]|uniref:M56 family metallopeptidase n=1 Tax=Mycolicibacterium sp. CBMA 234 TaxID=1918495 RepID=UPI001390C82A|nr:M56 family metallopeptidase [Mycolicibacterium sp. CBMA 234]MUL62828.1 Zn-dependent protease with chaperone function [Mycolicibacterium sp. CBMA 234]